jgi:hypothetical protein
MKIAWRVAVFSEILFASWSVGTQADPQQTAQQTQVQRGEYLARAGDCVSQLNSLTTLEVP